ncbi:hypothetical protein Esti_002633 [Eimeria stiedai]
MAAADASCAGGSGECLESSPHLLLLASPSSPSAPTSCHIFEANTRGHLCCCSSAAAAAAAAAKEPLFVEKEGALPSLRTRRKSPVLLATQDGLYVVAGGDSSSGLCGVVELASGASSSVRWRAAGNLHQPRSKHAGCVVAGVLPVVLGGSSSSSSSGSNAALASVEMCDPVRHSAWINLPPMLQQRQQLAAVAVGNMLMAMGGRGSTGNQGLVLRTCECLALPLSPRTAAPTAATAAAVAAAPSAPGPGETPRGKGGGPRPSLKGPLGSWGPLPSMRQARCRFPALHVRGKVFCVGGLSGVKALSSVEVFDASRNRWVEGPPLNVPRIGASLLLWFGAGIEGNASTPLLLVLGGHSVSEETGGGGGAAGVSFANKALKSAETLDLQAFFFSAFGQRLPPLQQQQEQQQQQQQQQQLRWVLHQHAGLGDLALSCCTVVSPQWEDWASELPPGVFGGDAEAEDKPQVFLSTAGRAAAAAASGRRSVPQSLSASGPTCHGPSPQTSEELRRLLPKGRVAAASRLLQQSAAAAAGSGGSRTWRSSLEEKVSLEETPGELQRLHSGGEASSKAGSWGSCLGGHLRVHAPQSAKSDAITRSPSTAGDTPLHAAGKVQELRRAFEPLAATGRTREHNG